MDVARARWTFKRLGKGDLGADERHGKEREEARVEAEKHEHPETFRIGGWMDLVSCRRLDGL